MLRPQIENWTSDLEAEELARLAADRRVLEVGSYHGFGTVIMAQAGAEVWALDWHQGDRDLGDLNTLPKWWRNVRRHELEDRVVGLVGRSERVLPVLKRGYYDLVFVDGYHSYEQARLDLLLSIPLLAPNGVLAVHDYCPTWPSVVRAVDELFGALPREPPQFRLVDSLAVIDRSLAFPTKFSR